MNYCSVYKKIDKYGFQNILVESILCTENYLLFTIFRTASEYRLIHRFPALLLKWIKIEGFSQ